jgi:hypothetical protein
MYLVNSGLINKWPFENSKFGKKTLIWGPPCDVTTYINNVLPC